MERKIKFLSFNNPLIVIPVLLLLIIFFILIFFMPVIVAVLSIPVTIFFSIKKLFKKNKNIEVENSSSKIIDVEFTEKPDEKK